MAMIAMAPTSSTMASVSRKILSDGATRAPSRLTTPTAMAMSVAIGIAHPEEAVATGVDGEEHRGGHDHPADRSDGGEGGAPRLAQLAVDELALDLQPDDEEEDRHQALVDPPAEVEGELVAADIDAEHGVPELDVGVLPRRVGPHEGDRGGDEQGHAAGGLGAQEVPQRAEYDRSLVGPHPFGHQPVLVGAVRSGCHAPWPPARGTPGRARPRRRRRRCGASTHRGGGSPSSPRPRRVAATTSPRPNPSSSTVPSTRLVGREAGRVVGRVAGAVAVGEQGVVVLRQEAGRRRRPPDREADHRGRRTAPAHARRGTCAGEGAGARGSPGSRSGETTPRRRRASAGPNAAQVAQHHVVDRRRCLERPAEPGLGGRQGDLSAPPPDAARRDLDEGEVVAAGVGERAGVEVGESRAELLAQLRPSSADARRAAPGRRRAPVRGRRRAAAGRTSGGGRARRRAPAGRAAAAAGSRRR